MNAAVTWAERATVMFFNDNQESAQPETFCAHLPHNTLNIAGNITINAQKHMKRYHLCFIFMIKCSDFAVQATSSLGTKLLQHFYTLEKYLS